MKTNNDSGLENIVTTTGTENEQIDTLDTPSKACNEEPTFACDQPGDTRSKFQAIFEHSPLAIMFTDADGVITTCNDNASQLFGAPKSKLIGFSFKSIRDEMMRAAVAKALSGQKSRYEGEYLTVTGNVYTNMRANFSPAFNSDGTVSGVIGVFEDITERRNAEKDTERLVRELQDALSKVKKLSGILPICASCKRIRDDKGSWNEIESYLRDNFDIAFSHGICPECAEKIYKM